MEEQILVGLGTGADLLLGLLQPLQKPVLCGGAGLIGEFLDDQLISRESVSYIEYHPKVII
ncbi:hypothetical protein [Clostridium phoceensis]|uniref:hypothetical protein n=1 Tax=Clostridium phoceensis TaxID=1650661 RepID=UPI002E795028|nr:hypothetical protein [Clostridium phoceensis]